VLTLRADLEAALLQARTSSPTAVGWLEQAPAGAHAISRIQAMPAGISLEACRRALWRWDLHRRAGLRAVADGEVAVGTNVVLQARFGALSATAPCRVVRVIDTPVRVGFEYATLPGHPEMGVESFEFVSGDDHGIHFVMQAVSRPAFIGSRMLPFVARRIQQRITDRYVQAALDIARGG